jgi:hypothetical protein
MRALAEKFLSLEVEEKEWFARERFCFRRPHMYSKTINKEI